MSAALALEQLACAVRHDVVRVDTAARAPGSVLPSRMADRLDALSIGAKAGELGDRHAGLKLDGIHGHARQRSETQPD